MSRVLVTGGSGFLASYCILQLLNQGHEVATTVRKRSREADVRAMIGQGGGNADAPLDFYEADLERDSGWSEAAHGCRYVLHVASPFVGSAPLHENDLIVPAREGTLRVLRAARKANVGRVVLTSSFGAIGYGHKPQEGPFTESDWTDISRPEVFPYIKSKTIAERAAWDFVAREGGAMELSVINPSGIFGPVLGPDYSASIEIVSSMLAGKVPAVPRTYFGMADVRDVADLHLRAMTSAKAAGERFIAVAGDTISMLDVAKILRRELGTAASRVPTRQMPDFLVHLLALFSPRMREIALQIGKRRRASNAKARSLLGWSPRPNEEVIAATGRSLLALTEYDGRARAR